MFVGDHPRVLPAYRHQTVVLDRAIAGDGELTPASRKSCTARSTRPPSRNWTWSTTRPSWTSATPTTPASRPQARLSPRRRHPHAHRHPGAVPRSGRAAPLPAAGSGQLGRCGMSAAASSAGLRQLPAVGLEELNTEAALQTRVDRKYVVPVDCWPGSSWPPSTPRSGSWRWTAPDLRLRLRVLRHPAAGQLPAGGPRPPSPLQDPHQDLCGQRHQLPGGQDGRRPRGHRQGTHPL